jgi:hypothetical protein
LFQQVFEFVFEPVITVGNDHLLDIVVFEVLQVSIPRQFIGERFPRGTKDFDNPVFQETSFQWRWQAEILVQEDF